MREAQRTPIVHRHDRVADAASGRRAAEDYPQYCVSLMRQPGAIAALNFIGHFDNAHENLVAINLALCFTR